eukprot:jgi/Bigna1/70553/fgenesh1_pg.12_\
MPFSQRKDRKRKRDLSAKKTAKPEEWQENKRKWEESGRPNEEGVQRQPGKKKFVAVLFGYHGGQYQGLQINPGAKTIEAAVEVISLKLLIVGNEEAMVEAINRNIDPDIKIFKILPVTKSFHAKNQCTSRTYDYILPSYALQRKSDWHATKLAKEAAAVFPKLDMYRYAMKQVKRLPRHLMKLLLDRTATPPADDDDGEDDDDKKAGSAVERTATQGSSSGSSSEDRDRDGGFKDVLEQVALLVGQKLRERFQPDAKRATSPVATTMAEFRLSQEKREAFNQLLSNYLGTKNHHNFTKRGGDSTSASFMLHQIRKMIGMADNREPINSTYPIGDVEESVYGTVFGEEKIHVPKAPALGLHLHRCHFHGYNLKVRHIKERESFEEACESVADTIEAFTKEKIIQRICDEELRAANVFAQHLAHSRFAEYLTLYSRHPWGTKIEEEYTPDAFYFDCADPFDHPQIKAACSAIVAKLHASVRRVGGKPPSSRDAVAAAASNVGPEITMLYEALAHGAQSHCGGNGHEGNQQSASSSRELEETGGKNSTNGSYCALS